MFCCCHNSIKYEQQIQPNLFKYEQQIQPNLFIFYLLTAHPASCRQQWCTALSLFHIQPTPPCNKCVFTFNMQDQIIPCHFCHFFDEVGRNADNVIIRLIILSQCKLIKFEIIKTDWTRWWAEIYFAKILLTACQLCHFTFLLLSIISIQWLVSYLKTFIFF